MGAEHLKIKVQKVNTKGTESDFLLDGSQIDITLKHVLNQSR